MEKSQIFLLLRVFPLFVLFLFIVSCATAPKPIAPVVPGGSVETLQSLVSLKVKAGGRSIGGKGYLIFKKPDRFHLALLSPFGTTMMEVFLDGERITCILPSKQTAYAGLLSDIPDRNALRSWGMMREVIDIPAIASPPVGEMEYTSADGKKEVLAYDSRGLLLRKVTADGDRISYNDYQNVNSVAFPRTIEMQNRSGDNVRVVFEEPEVNTGVEASALAPDLEGLTILPITDFRGI